MPKNYILIDYENVQPKTLGTLKEKGCKILVFVGPNQNRIPFDLASGLQQLGADAEYIKIGAAGPNALDFHLAYYVGKLVAQDPEGYYHIISKDKGFDPLVRHLRNEKVHIQRAVSLDHVPLLNVSQKASRKEKVNAIVEKLKGMGTGRPRKVKTLTNTINDLFQRSIKEHEIKQLIIALKVKNYIVIENENVSYNPPIKQS